jgi:hypothetical protein
MCGIEGGVSFGADLPVENTIVACLNEFQRHRGPDGEGGVWASDDIETGRLGNQTLDKSLGHNFYAAKLQPCGVAFLAGNSKMQLCDPERYSSPKSI